MILRAVQIQRYKCIEDTGTVHLDPRLTCLVGKNESGKTAFLETLYRLSPIASGLRTPADGAPPTAKRSAAPGR